MAKWDIDEIKAEMNLKPFGAQGWLSNRNDGCAFCGRQGKWGLLMDKVEGLAVYHCWYCNMKTSLYNWLKQNDRLDLWHSSFENSIKKDSLPRFEDESMAEKEKEELPEVGMPDGCRPVTHDPYLDSRGFTDASYSQFEPCVTDHILEKKLHGYFIFKMKMDGRVVAWLARSTREKKWHEQNMKDFKAGNAPLRLRYENSTGTNFTKLVGGYDDITARTECVIVVEGMFDKINVDRQLDLASSDGVKCVFTFGNSISRTQIGLLLEKKSVKEVILMYDPDVLPNFQSASISLARKVKTYVAVLRDKKKDPGDANADELWDAVENVRSAFGFYSDIT